jgi:hypothetical protein
MIKETKDLGKIIVKQETKGTLGLSEVEVEVEVAAGILAPKLEQVGAAT